MTDDRIAPQSAEHISAWILEAQAVLATWETKEAAQKAREAEILPANKAVLFAALAAAGIQKVIVEFDGCGDSGQIESTTGFDSHDAEADLPDQTITLQSVDFETSAIEPTNATIPDAIESMAWGFLRDAHGIWEDNDGASGKFTFSVAEQSIALEYWERYTETTYSEHEF